MPASAPELTLSLELCTGALQSLSPLSHSISLSPGLVHSSQAMSYCTGWLVALSDV